MNTGKWSQIVCRLAQTVAPFGHSSAAGELKRGTILAYTCCFLGRVCSFKHSTSEQMRGCAQEKSTKLSAQISVKISFAFESLANLALLARFSHFRIRSVTGKCSFAPAHSKPLSSDDRKEDTGSCRSIGKGREANKRRPFLVNLKAG